MWGNPYGWPGTSWAGMTIMTVGMALWLLLLGLLVWGVIRWRIHQSHLNHQQGAYIHSNPSAHEILEQRYARGEIDETTFDHMRAELAQTGASAQRLSDHTDHTDHQDTSIPQ
ncbi:MAG: SHOCT domain-containing protein, partial [Ktedonobacterales bacterium]